MSTIRVVDIATIALTVDTPHIEHFRHVGKELSEAFEDIGFVFVTNHGIEEKLIADAREVSKEYFQLEANEKLCDEKGTRTPPFQGWVKPGKEIFDQDEEGKVATLELRESYDMSDFSSSATFPDTTVPTFRPCLTALAERSKTLTYRILKCLS